MNIYIQILLQILRAIIFYDLDLLSEILRANLLTAFDGLVIFEMFVLAGGEIFTFLSMVPVVTDITCDPIIKVITSSTLFTLGAHFFCCRW